MSYVEYPRQDHSAHQIKSQYDSYPSPHSYPLDPPRPLYPALPAPHDMSTSSDSSTDSAFVSDRLLPPLDTSHGSRVPSLSPPPQPSTATPTEPYTYPTFADQNGRAASPQVGGSQGSRSGRTSVEPVPFARQSTPLHQVAGDGFSSSTGTSGGAIRVVRWAPEHGDEGTPVTIVLDPVALQHVFPNSNSSSSFGPGSPLLGSPNPSSSSSPKLNLPSPPTTRRFVVLFGGYSSPTKYSRANQVNELGLSRAEDAEPFVVLTTYVPARQSMGSLGERVMVVIRIVDEASRVLDECMVGEWDPVSQASSPRIGSLKRQGEDLVGERDGPGRHSRSPTQTSTEWANPPQPHRPISPAPRARPITPPDADQTTRGAPPRPPPPQFYPPVDVHPPQPELIRTSQIPSRAASNGSGTPVTTFSNKAVLKFQGDLDQMAMGWSNDEWTNRRRLVQFWRNQEGNIINTTFRPIAQNDYIPNSIVVSCIFRDDWNECFITSVDTIYLLEALVGTRFTVEEKNRIRRNIEGFKPITVSKAKAESDAFFKLIMGFPSPKPRNIEKDVKVFPWKVLSSSLKKIISKYSATYTAPIDVAPEPVIPQAGPSSPRPLDHFPSHHEQPHPQPSPHSTPSPPHLHPSIASAQFTSRPNPFDFNAILDSSQFSSSSSGGPSNAPSNGVVYAPPENHAYPPSFPPHDLYSPQPSEVPNAHIRSYSDGPKRGGGGYATSSGWQGEYYAQQQEWEGRRETGWRSFGPMQPPRPASADGVQGGRGEMMYHLNEYPHER